MFPELTPERYGSLARPATDGASLCCVAPVAVRVIVMIGVGVDLVGAVMLALWLPKSLT